LIILIGKIFGMDSDRELVGKNGCVYVAKPRV
jgi:hypothetical protein